DRGRTLREVSHGGGVRHAQLAWNGSRALRRPARALHGRLRYLRDQDQRLRDARRHAAPRRRSDRCRLPGGHGITDDRQRNTDPLDQVVVSVTQFHAGDTWNVIPPQAILRGTVRTFRKDVQDATEAAMARVVQGISAGCGATGTLRYERRY